MPRMRAFADQVAARGDPADAAFNQLLQQFAVIFRQPDIELDLADERTGQAYPLFGSGKPNDASLDLPGRRAISASELFA